MYRKTYAEINLTNIKHNVKEIINKYNDYTYYLGVVKADAYGHGAIKVADAIIKSGVNYLVVALLEEALELRQKYPKIPILCLGMIEDKDIKIAIKNDITLSILSLDYLNTLNINKLKKAKVHIKLNTGMNRLGIKTKEELNEVYKKLTKNNINIEGIYSHIHSSKSKKETNKQFQIFTCLTSDIDLAQIKIVHIAASSTLTKYPKPDYINGCRLGIIMYGFTEDKSLNLKSTFKLRSSIIQINTITPNETVGYDGKYKAHKKERIAVIPIGYADGITRNYTNSKVYIQNKPYKIVGNICMDMLFVKIDDNIQMSNTVEIIKDNNHIKEISQSLHTIPYEILCNISKRIPRIYINN